MKYKFLTFMKKWFHKQGDCCPKEQWDIFIINEFAIEEQENAILLTNRLLEDKYIELIEKDNGKYFAVSGFGVEMINRDLLEVEL